MKFGMTNSYSPNLVQRGGLLVCSYAAPKDLSSSLFCSSSKMWTHVVWPAPMFDKQGLFVLDETGQRYTACGKDTLLTAERPSWRVASRNECYIGLGCMQPTTVEPATDADNGIKMEINGDHIFASRITTQDKNSVYIVIVASHDEYENNFASFVDRCLSVRFKQDYQKTNESGGRTKRVMKVQVHDAKEGSVIMETIL